MEKDDDNIIGRYTLNTGLFSVCSGLWDENKQKIIKADTTNIMKCCINNCMKSDNLCNELCKKENDVNFDVLKCNKTCKYIKNLCIDSCDLESYIWNDNNPFIDCSKNKGCWKNNNVFDSKCIKNNKLELIDCCNNNCISTSDIDCEKHCDYSFELASNENIKTSDIKFNKSINYNDHTFIYILIGIIITILISIIIIFILYRKKMIFKMNYF